MLATTAPSQDRVVISRAARHADARAGSAGNTSTGYGAAATAPATSGHADWSTGSACHGGTERYSFTPVRTMTRGSV
ncbi:hypothetical protein GCM10010169_00620 [Micromonospora fulviviridis]|nr:hypothetical protein GCM10010169_00620 [Micromonospora fulviviridis]